MRLRTVRHGGRAAIRTGFTLMELLVVIAILLVLIGVATPMYMNYLEQSKARTARINAKSLATELSNFAISHDGQYPPEGDWSMLPLPPEKIPPLDPWGKPFQWGLRPIRTGDGTEFMNPVVWSTGPVGSHGADGEYSSLH